MYPISLVKALAQFAARHPRVVGGLSFFVGRPVLQSVTETAHNVRTIVGVTGGIVKKTGKGVLWAGSQIVRRGSHAPLPPVYGPRDFRSHPFIDMVAQKHPAFSFILGYVAPVVGVATLRYLVVQIFRGKATFLPNRKASHIIKVLEKHADTL